MANTSDNKDTDKNKSSTEAGKTTHSQSSDPSVPQGTETWGYDLYPERRGEPHKRDWLKTLLMIEGRDNLQKIRCEKNVYKCVKMNPLVQLMMGALKSSGCEIDIRRHISCELCDESVSGGYDPELNQIVVCQNTSTSIGIVGGVLTHEMIHMFDFCRNNLDFKNLDHLACTEIRAANLTHCSFLAAASGGDASFFNIKARHKECVKSKAVASVMTTRRVSSEEARAAVERVFPKCYPDLEPVGRRPRAKSNDSYKAYAEAPLFGYDY